MQKALITLLYLSDYFIYLVLLISLFVFIIYLEVMGNLKLGQV